MDPRLKAIIALAKALEKDLGNRYILNKDWVLPSFPIEDLAISDKHKDLLRKLEDSPIVVGKLAIYAQYDRLAMTIFKFTEKEISVDGATGAPDNLPGVVKAAMFHDVWYTYMELIAEWTGIPVKVVRKIGDQIFGNLIYVYGEKTVKAKITSQVYYAGVRAFGGIAHQIGKLFVVLLIVVTISGCLSPIEFGDLTEPAIEKIK